MQGIKETVYSTYTVGLFFMYIGGYKEEVRHSPKTLTLKSGTHTRKKKYH